MSKQVIVELPEGAFSAFRSEPAELGREMRLAAAVKWYEMGRLTQAKAAEFAGLSRYEFIHALGRFGTSPLQETVEELSEGLTRERYLPSIGPVLHRLETEVGFRLSESAKTDALRAVGEI